jgi:hypothetical protein
MTEPTVPAPPDGDLYRLLPELHRLRDDERGGLLKALLNAVETQYAVVADDLEQLLDDWFIETCADWVVPYIGDLLAVGSAHDITAALLPGGERARVANTIGYRRRKGTVAVIEALTRDTTGWPAHVVEAFLTLDWAQHVNHVRLDRTGSADLRGCAALGLVGGPFDAMPRTADIRSIVLGRGRHNLPDVALWAWRLVPYSVARRTAPAVADPSDGRFRADPLDRDLPLANPGRAETTITQLSTELDVPGALRRRVLYDELEALRQAIVDARPVRPQWFGPQPVLRIFVQAADGDPVVEVLPERIVICDLDDPVPPLPEVWRRPPATLDYTPEAGGPPVALPVTVGIDPATGRIAFPVGTVPYRVEVSAAHHAPADIGGGPYQRGPAVDAALAGRGVDWQRGVSVRDPAEPGVVVGSITAAITEWNALSPHQPPAGLITVMDSHRYDGDLAGPQAIHVDPGCVLLLVGARWPQLPVPGGLPGETARQVGVIDASGVLPCIGGSIEVTGGAAAGRPPGELVINGLWIDGSVAVTAGPFGRLSLSDVTVVPGGAGIATAAGDADVAVELTRCVTAAIAVPDGRSLSIHGCVVAGAVSAPRAALTTEASTFFATVDVQQVLASDAIFVEPLTVARRQVGCTRFCWLADGSVTPRRFRCQPDLALASPHTEPDDVLRARLAPSFTSESFADPAFAQLATGCAVEIAAGASTGGETGAFRDVQQPQRQSNVRSAFDEYLPWGLEAGLLYST